MKRENLAPGVFLNTLDAQKFNRCRITIRFQYPACRETATASAVMPAHTAPAMYRQESPATNIIMQPMQANTMAVPSSP